MLTREEWLIELIERDLQNKYVSHYTSLETIVFEIIPSNKIKFSTQENTNDPYEFKIDLGVVIAREPFDKEFYQKGMDFLEHHVKVFSTSISSKQRISPKYTPLTDCSFGNVMMWAQYGNNHNGAVLLFDRSELEKEIKENFEKCFVDKVSYKNVSNINFSVSHNNEKTFLDNIYSELEKDKENRFFSKQNEWSSEKEMRWVILNESKKGSEFINFKKSLKAIILGEKTKDKHVKVVSKLLKETNIELYKLNWDNIGEKNFKLNKISD